MGNRKQKEVTVCEASEGYRPIEGDTATLDVAVYGIAEEKGSDGVSRPVLTVVKGQRASDIAGAPVTGAPIKSIEVTHHEMQWDDELKAFEVTVTEPSEKSVDHYVAYADDNAVSGMSHAMYNEAGHLALRMAPIRMPGEVAVELAPGQPGLFLIRCDPFQDVAMRLKPASGPNADPAQKDQDGDGPGNPFAEPDSSTIAVDAQGPSAQSENG